MSSLTQIVIAHHVQAATMAKKTLRCNYNRDCVIEFKRHGNKFTTRVEKRLRKLEYNR